MSPLQDRPQDPPDGLDQGTVSKGPSVANLAAGGRVQARFVTAPELRQPTGSRPDPGLIAIAAIAGHYRIAADPSQMAHDLGLGDRSAAGEDIMRAAKRIGLNSRLLKGQDPKRLASVPMPAILRMKDGAYRILLARSREGRFRVGDPLSRSARDETVETLDAVWDGEIILVTRRWGGAGIDPATFGFRWFLPSLWRYRKPLAHVLIASLFVQLFALITPLFFQIVIDKVLVHKGLSTLDRHRRRARRDRPVRRHVAIPALLCAQPYHQPDRC